MSGARDSVRFRLGEGLVAWLLVRMAAIANKRGDLHEVWHIVAQLEAGESVACGPDCQLGRNRPLDGVHVPSDRAEQPFIPGSQSGSERP